jgi:xanthine/uracil permease
VTDKVIKSAKWGEFLWVHTFPIGFYAPAVLPCLLGFLVTTMECIGDVTATRETSNLPVSGDYELGPDSNLSLIQPADLFSYLLPP